MQYKYLEKFIEIYNRFPAEWEKYPDGNNLGNWVLSQRKQYINDQLNENKIIKLNKLNFVFNTNDASWNIQYALLIDLLL